MKKVISGVMVMMMLFSSTLPAWADDVAELKAMVQQMKSDYESKISQLESKIKQLESSQTKEMAQIKKEVTKNKMDIEYVGHDEGGVAIQGPGDSQVTVGGYVDAEFANFENTNSEFDQHRFVLMVGAQVGERLRFFSETEIEHGGPDASGSGSLKVEAAHIDYLIEDWVNLRAGAMMVPFGRYNIYHDSDFNDLTDRPLMARRVIPTTWTESGAGFFGEFETLGETMVNYQAYVVNGLDDTTIDDRGLRNARGSLGSDNNNNKSWVGRVGISPWLNTEIGLSGYTGKYNNNGDGIDGGAVDLNTRFGDFELTTEYAHFNVDDNNGVDIADTIAGGYVQLGYDFWPEFLDDSFLGRSFDDPTLTLVGRYGWADIDDDADAGTGDNEEDRFTLGIAYRPTSNFVWKLEYQWNDTENEAIEKGSNDGFITSFALGF